MSDADNTISFSSTASASLTVYDTAIGLISSYRGDDYSSNTWDGDSSVDGWLGLAYDPSNDEYNILKRMYDYGYMDSMIFSLYVDLGDTSTLSIGETSSDPTWYTSADPDAILWGADIVGFMVTTTPST